MECKITNRFNPLDFLGVWHNYALDEVSKVKDFDQLSLKEIYDIIIKSNGNCCHHSSNFAELKDFYEKDLPVLLDAKEKVTDLIFCWNRINMPTKQLLDVMCNIISLNREKAPNDLYQNLMNFECTVIKNYGFTIDDKQKKELVFKYQNDEPFVALVLGASVIARYSYSYWYSANNNPESPWYNILNKEYSHDPNPGPNGHKPRVPRWLRAAWKDIVGFFTADGCTEVYVDAAGNVIRETNLNCCIEYAQECSAAVKE